MSLVRVYPLVITLVQSGKIVDTDSLLIFPAPFLDLGHKIRNGRLEIDEQVRHLYQRHHQIEQV